MKAVQHLLFVILLASCQLGQNSTLSSDSEPLPTCEQDVMIKCSGGYVDSCSLSEAKSSDRHSCVPAFPCVDTSVKKLYCQDEQVATHAGCPGENHIKRCASCVVIAAMMCAQDSEAVEVPECEESGKGDCLPKVD